jgi:hypothetical protein
MTFHLAALPIYKPSKIVSTGVAPARESRPEFKDRGRPTRSFEKVPQLIASIITKPNGSGQSIGINRPTAPERKAGLGGTQLQLLCADRQGEARGVSLGHRGRFE